MKKIKKVFLFIILIYICSLNIFAQNTVDPYSNKNKFINNKVFNNKYNYHKPTDSLVINKISEWQKLKFGLMMHWGPYTQWNIIESWSLYSDPWCYWTRKTGPYGKSVV